MGVPRCYDELKAAIKGDPELAWSWHCDIAMPIFDAGVDHVTANRAAASVMFLLFDTATIDDPKCQEIMNRTDGFDRTAAHNEDAVERDAKGENPAVTAALARIFDAPKGWVRDVRGNLILSHPITRIEGCTSQTSLGYQSLVKVWPGGYEIYDEETLNDVSGRGEAIRDAVAARLTEEG